MAHRVLAGIQRHLEAIYAIERQHAVQDFVIGDAELEALVGAGLVEPELKGTGEQVLVVPEGDGFSLALYLGDEIQGALAREGSLQAHCHATEGVSHFLLLLWSASQGRPLRRLDLELQAEVDKATTCLLLDHGATGGRGRHQLLRRLFDSVEFGAHLDPGERHRYREAHRLAQGYAGRLATLLDRGVGALLAELRLFYRMPAEDKRRRALAA